MEAAGSTTDASMEARWLTGSPEVAGMLSWDVPIQSLGDKRSYAFEFLPGLRGRSTIGVRGEKGTWHKL